MKERMLYSFVPKLYCSLALVFMTALSFSQAAFAQNLVVFDDEIVVSKGTQHWKAAEGLPNDWTSPVDYRKGVCHVEWEIIEAPASTSEYTLQFGWKFPGKADRNYQLLRFKYLRLKSKLSARVHPEDMPEEVPVPYLIAGQRYHTIHLMDDGLYFWPKNEKEPKDYSRGINGMMAFLRNKEWSVVGPPSKIKIRIRMTVVPEGARFVPAGSYGGLRSDGLKHLLDVAKAMQGKQPGKALLLAQKYGDTEDKAKAEEAKRVIKAINQYVADEKQNAEKMWDADPIYAFEQLSSLAQSMLKTDHYAGLNDQLKTWKKSDQYKQAYKAHRAWQSMQKYAASLKAKLDGKDFSDETIAKRYQRDGRQLMEYAKAIKNRYPDDPVTARAMNLLKSYGLPVPE